ncbi:MAG TPA: hypothetical protein ACFCUY_12980 [Xenococcaceae cyanobacterium]
MNSSNYNKKKTIPQWQLERMQMLIASQWNEILHTINFRVSNHDRNYW